jgi:hypothetical protein
MMVAVVTSREGAGSTLSNFGSGNGGHWPPESLAASIAAVGSPRRLHQDHSLRRAKALFRMATSRVEATSTIAYGLAHFGGGIPDRYHERML